MTLRIADEGKTVSKQGKFVSSHDVKAPPSLSKFTRMIFEHIILLS